MIALAGIEWSVGNRQKIILMPAGHILVEPIHLLTCGQRSDCPVFALVDVTPPPVVARTELSVIFVPAASRCVTMASESCCVASALGTPISTATEATGILFYDRVIVSPERTPLPIRAG